MKRGIQQIIVNKSGLSKSLVSEILSGKKRPSWDSAKILAAVTDTDPVIWMEGGSDKIKKAVEEAGKIAA